jgi:hypothetical protein
MNTTRRQFIGHTAAVAFAWSGTTMAMTQLQRMIVLAPPSLSPTGQSIVNELRRLGFTPSDDLKRWIEAAVTATGSKHFEVRIQPSDSQSIGFNLTGTGRTFIHWGDGRSAALILSATPQIVAHSYATAGKRAVVLVGNVAIS